LLIIIIKQLLNNFWDNELFLKNKTISKEESKIKKPVNTIKTFLRTYEKYKDLDLQKGISFPKRVKNQKVIPSIQIATFEEAIEISQIFKDVYNNTYSYKELEDEKAIQDMIKDPNFYWIVFKINLNKIIGCIGFHIDLDNKIGTFHGLVFKQEYQGSTDLVELLIACLYSILNIYEKKILIWSCEIRSAHVKSQHSAKFLQLLPIAFLPNKDLFYNIEESEILYVLYDDDALKQYRSPKIPIIPHQVLNSYIYTVRKFNIGSPVVKNVPALEYNEKEINKYKNYLIEKIEKDKYGNENIQFSLKNSNSFFKFFHNKFIYNIEKVSYYVSSKEELKVFIERLNTFIQEKKIRYCECLVSAYNHVYQSIFLNAGFEPFGYIPSFKYNKNENLFEDQIVFIQYKGALNKKNLILLPESKELIHTLKPLWEL